MKLNKVLFTVILLVVTLNCVAAIGVTPGKSTLIYPEGLDKVMSFTILDVDEEVGYDISVGGELAEYITIENSPASLYPYRESNKFYYKLDIPEDVLSELAPGEHVMEIMIREKVDEEVFAVAVPAVVHQVVFFIPYPAKYLSSKVEIIEGDKNETTEFLIPVANLGEEKIESVYGEIGIFDKQGSESLGNITTNVASLESSQRNDLSASWDNDVEAGIYKAEVNLIYDNEIATYYKYFKVGNVFLDVSDILIEDFDLGSIVTFHVLVDNQWGEDLDNIYASMILYDESGKLAHEVKSPVDSIKAFEQKRIPIYWDTTDVEEGVYDGKLIVYYDLYKTEKKLHVEIFDNDIKIQIQEGEFVLKTPSYKRLIFVLSSIILFVVAFFVFKKLTRKK